MSTPSHHSTDDDFFSTLHLNLNAHNLGLLAAVEEGKQGQTQIDQLYNSYVSSLPSPAPSPSRSSSSLSAMMMGVDEDGVRDVEVKKKPFLIIPCESSLSHLLVAQKPLHLLSSSSSFPSTQTPTQSTSNSLGLSHLSWTDSQNLYTFGAFTAAAPTTGVNTTPLTDLDPYFTSPLETLIGSDFGVGGLGAGSINNDEKALDINEIIFSSPPTSVVGLQSQTQFQGQEMNKNVRASPSINSGSGLSNQGQGNGHGNGNGQGLFPSVLPPPPMVSKRTNSTSSTTTTGTGTSPAQNPVGTIQAQVQSPEEKIWNGMDWGRVLDEAEEGRKEKNIPSVPNPIQGSTRNTNSIPISATSLTGSSPSQPTSSGNPLPDMSRIIIGPNGPIFVTPDMIQNILAQQARQQQQENARQQAQLQARAQAEAHLKGYERSLLLQRYYQAQQAQQHGSSNVNNIEIGHGSGMGMGMGMEMFQGMATGMGVGLNATQAPSTSGGPIFESGVGFAFASSTPSSEYSFPTQSLPSQGPTPVSSQRMSFAIPLTNTNAFGAVTGTHSAVGTPGSVFSSVLGMGNAGSPAPGDSVSQVGVNTVHGQAMENSPLVPIANIAGTDKDGFKIPATGPIRSVKGIKDIRNQTSSGPVSVIEDKGKGKAVAVKGKGKKSGGARTLAKGKRPPHDRGQGRKPSTSSSNQDSPESPEEYSSRRSHDPNGSRLTGSALDLARSSVLANMDPEDVKKERRREINRRSARTLREKRKAELDEAMDVVRSLRKEVKVLREGLKQESEWRRQVEGVFKERGIDLASYGIQTPSTFSTPTPTASTSRQPLDHDMDDDHAGFDSDAQGSDLDEDDDESDFD